MRQVFVLLHRYVGLVMTLFLVVAGFTGIFIAFYDALEAWIRPEVMLVDPVPNQPMLHPIALAELVQKQYPHAMIRRIPLHPSPEKSVRFFLRPRPDASETLANNEVFVNPYTGALLGARKWGDITQGTINLMPFIYRLHFSLALDKIGRYALGIIALLWSIDCFVGAYLTFPQKQKKRAYAQPLSQRARGVTEWLGRWKKSWKIRWEGGFYKINFDLHRAGGLWVWAMLFVFAWSGVAFNLTEVYRPVMKKLFANQTMADDLPALAQPLLTPTLNWQTALTEGQKMMQQASAQQHFTIHHEGDIAYSPDKGIYLYSVNSSLDISEKSANTRVMFDANTGQRIALYLPTGAASGNTITEWLFALHMATVWGLPMQIFVSVMGVVVVMLSITGVYIWWKKRKSRIVMQRQRLAVPVLVHRQY